MLLKQAAPILLALGITGVGPISALAADPATVTSGTETTETAHCAETARNRTTITAFADLFYRQQDIKQAMMTYVAPDYIQHSPRVANGRAAMLEMAKRFEHSKATFEIKRIMVDGDMAVVHVKGQLGPNMPTEAVVDIYRLKDGKIVEHWDVTQPVPTTSANQNTVF